MENSIISTDELNNLSKETIILLFTQQSQNFKIISDQYQTLISQSEKHEAENKEYINLLMAQIADLKEQVAILTQQRFGSRSEKNLDIPGQLSIPFDDVCVFNEVEAVAPDDLSESSLEEVITYTRKKPGKRSTNISAVDKEVVYHDLTEEELCEKFPNGWHELDEAAPTCRGIYPFSSGGVNFLCAII